MELTLEQLGTVLGVWAHPDDEAFLTAGLMGRLVDRGHHVACATATRGELGTNDAAAWPVERLGRRRALELRASLAVLGVHDHRFLGHLDGTLAALPIGYGAELVSRVVDEVRPDTVVTFGPEGMTGHADHIAVSHWTTRAVHDAVDDIRLLYAATSVESVDRWSVVNRSLGAFGEGLPRATTPEDIALEVRLDGDELDRKLVALAAQSSQIVPLVARLGEDVFREWWSTESFA